MVLICHDGSADAQAAIDHAGGALATRVNPSANNHPDDTSSLLHRRRCGHARRASAPSAAGSEGEVRRRAGTGAVRPGVRASGSASTGPEHAPAPVVGELGGPSTTVTSRRRFECGMGRSGRMAFARPGVNLEGDRCRSLAKPFREGIAHRPDPDAHAPAILATLGNELAYLVDLATINPSEHSVRNVVCITIRWWPVALSYSPTGLDHSPSVHSQRTVSPMAWQISACPCTGQAGTGVRDTSETCSCRRMTSASIDAPTRGQEAAAGSALLPRTG